MRSPDPPSRRLATRLAAAILVVGAAGATVSGCLGAGSRPDRGEGEADLGRPAPEPRLIRHGPRSARRVALTFDADMTPSQLDKMEADSAASSWYDRRIVDELRRTRTPATIFMAGLWARAHPGPARKLARSPLFEIENHSLTHAGFRYPCFGLADAGSKRQKRKEVAKSSKVIERVTGVRPRYFRFPGGCHRPADLRLVARAGEQPLGWDVVSGDVAQRDPDVIVREVVSGVRPGSIVVMHLVGEPNAPATADALPRIIAKLRERGFELVKLEDVLRPQD